MVSDFGMKMLWDCDPHNSCIESLDPTRNEVTAARKEKREQNYTIDCLQGQGNHSVISRVGRERENQNSHTEIVAHRILFL